MSDFEASDNPNDKTMKHAFVILLILISSAFVIGQKTFEVQDFSKDLYGKVHIEQPTEVFSPGWVAIYEKKTNRQLIKVTSEELVSNTDEEGEIKVNVKELPYGEQSVIIYEDFNFDSVKDFAIMDGQNSCYHGPSFSIYLGGKIKNRFVLSKAFTRLAQEYCGMFQVDAATKTISTMTKSGCCWHQYSEFIVVNNLPKAVKIVEEDAQKYPVITVSTEIRKGARVTKTTSRKLDLDESEAKYLFSFRTNNDHQVILFAGEEELDYAFLDKNGNVEFAYPADADQDEPMFTLNADGTTLSFENKGVVYEIYETGDEKIGVRVNVKGKLSEIPGDFASRKGSLKSPANEKLFNVILKK